MMTKKEFLTGFKLDSKELTSEERRKLEDLLWEYQGIFSRDDLIAIGHTPAIKHRIDLLTEIPLKQRHRCIPPAIYQGG